jgi:hypothetical protein
VSHQTGVSVSNVVRFFSQSGEKGKGIVDAVGLDEEDSPILIIEAKFWAGLTDNQPVEYLERLPRDKKSLLLFLAPAQRSVTLWSELERRAALRFNIHPTEQGELSKALSLEGGRVMALMDWQSVLNFVLADLAARQELAATSDVSQLLGLCSRMDTEAFLPLQSEELTSNHGRRISQYVALVKDMVTILIKKGLVSTVGLKWTSNSPGVDGQYMRLSGYGAYLHVSPPNWMKYRETPIWLGIYDWDHAGDIRRKLAPLLSERPARAIESALDPNFVLIVPLFLPTGVERGAVLDTLVQQVEEVAGLLVEN